MTQQHTFALMLLTTVAIVLSMAANPYATFFASDVDNTPSSNIWDLHQHFEALPGTQKNSPPHRAENTTSPKAENEDTTIILGDEASSAWPQEESHTLIQE